MKAVVKQGLISSKNFPSFPRYITGLACMHKKRATRVDKFEIYERMRNESIE